MHCAGVTQAPFELQTFGEVHVPQDTKLPQLFTLSPQTLVPQVADRLSDMQGISGSPTAWIVLAFPQFVIFSLLFSSSILIGVMLIEYIIPISGGILKTCTASAFGSSEFPGPMRKKETEFPSFFAAKLSFKYFFPVI